LVSRLNLYVLFDIELPHFEGIRNTKGIPCYALKKYIYFQMEYVRVSRNFKIEIYFFISDYSLSVMLELLKEHLRSHTCDKVKFI